MPPHGSGEFAARDDYLLGAHGGREGHIHRVAWRMIERERDLQSEIVQLQACGWCRSDLHAQQRQAFLRFSLRDVTVMLGQEPLQAHRNVNDEGHGLARIIVAEQDLHAPRTGFGKQGLSGGRAAVGDTAAERGKALCGFGWLLPRVQTGQGGAQNLAVFGLGGVAMLGGAPSEAAHDASSRLRTVKVAMGASFVAEMAGVKLGHDGPVLSLRRLTA